MTFVILIRKKLSAFKVNEFLPKIIILIVSILLALFIAELVLSKINYPYQSCEEILDVSETYLGKFNPETGWSYKKMISYYDYRERYQYHFNQLGHRVPEPYYKTDYSKPIILFIGGSVTFGEQLPYDQTYAAQIGKLLGDEYEIVNLGVQGYGSAQSLLLLKSLVEEIDPAYIVYTFIPDHINRNITYDRRVHVTCAEFQGTSPVYGLRDDNLYLKKKPKKYTDMDNYKLPLLINMSIQRIVQENQIESGQAKEITRKIISEISAVAEDVGANDYYIYFDTSYNPNPNNWNMQTIKYLFGKSSDAKVLAFINWAPDSFPAGTKYYVHEEDDVHPNASLSAEIAKRFVEKFQDDFIR